MDAAKREARLVRKREEMHARALPAIERLLAGGTTWSQVSIDTLVNELGISRATLYTYYADKHDVLRTAATDVLRTLLDTASGWLGQTQALTEEELCEAIGATLRVYVQHRGVLLAMMEVATTDEALREQYQVVVGQADAALIKHIRAGQRKGFIDADLNARPTGTWLTRMMHTGMLRVLGPDDATDLDASIAAISRVVWNVLYAPVLVNAAD